MGMFGKRVLNQVGMNLLGVDFMGQADARRRQQAILAANAAAAGLLQPVPGQEYQAPIVNAEGQDISAGFAPQMDRGPPTRRGPAEIAAELGRLTAATPGFNPTPWKDLAGYAKPDIAMGPDGTPYDKGDPSTLSRRFRTPQAVNNTIVDVGNPENENRVIPSAPVAGAMPVYDNRGRVVDWTLPQGAQATIANAAGAESGGRAAGSAPYDFITVPGPNGQPMVVSKSRAVGGAFEGQTPADAEYDKGVATAEQKRYEGFLQSGAAARSMEANLRRMSGLLTDVNTGRLTPVGKDLASAASSFGIKVDPKWSSVEAADAIANKLVLDNLGGSLGAGFSNADRDFAKSMGPQTAQTPKGRQLIIDFAIKKAQRDQQVAGMARQWQQRAGRLDKPDRNGKTFYDYLDAWAEANPVVAR